MRRVQGRKTRGRVGRRYGHGRRQRQRTAGVGVDVGRTARPGKSRIRRQRLSRSMHPDPLTIRTVHKTLGVSLLPLPQYPLLPMDTLGCHSYRSVAISNASTSSLSPSLVPASLPPSMGGRTRSQEFLLLPHHRVSVLPLPIPRFYHKHCSCRSISRIS